MNTKMHKYRILIVVLIGVLAVLLGACDREAQKQQEIQKQRPQTLKEKGYDPVLFKMEVFGDPKIFNGPRLQFQWKPREEPRPSIWTSKLDGTDIRRVIEPQYIYYKGATEISNHTAIRSPNNRYLAISMFHEDTITKNLIDLKTKKVVEMAVSGGVPSFQFTPDSKQLYFYTDDALVKYDIASGKLQKQPRFYSFNFYLVDNGKRFLAIREHAIEYYDLNAKLIKSIPLDFETNQYNAVSKNGKKLLLVTGFTQSIFDITNLKAPEFKIDSDVESAAFTHHGDQLFFVSHRKIHEFDLKPKKDKIVVDLPGENIRFVSIINDG